MKRACKYIFAIFCAVVFLFSNAKDVFAASATLSGPSVVRAGDTITLNLNVSDSGKYGVEGTISYNSSQVSLVSATTSLSGWKYENNGNSFVLYDDQMASPLNGSKTVLTLKFKVASGVATGSAISISVNGLITTDGNVESNLGSANYNATVAAPLSTNNNLASLSVSAGKLSPGFSAGTTSYDLGQVDFSVSKITVTAKAADSKAKVAVAGNNLAVGKNTISVVVTAENGSTKTYKLTVTRKQDPNYQASSNNALSSITVSAGTLSPVFSSDITEYIIYLPYESTGSSFSATGTAADAKATGVTKAEITELKEGANKATVVCTAENGAQKKYNITVVVMPKYAGAVPKIEGVEVVVPEVDDTEDTVYEVDDSTTNAEKDDASKGEVNWVLPLIIGLIVGAGIGVGGVYLYIRFVWKDKTEE